MTSIEWLSEMVSKMGYVSADIVEQAKEMHKQNVINGFNQGYRDGFVDGMSGFCGNDRDVEKFDNANLYYNETFGSKVSGMSEKPTTQTNSGIPNHIELSNEEIEKFAIEKYAQSKKLFSSNYFSLHDLENHFIQGMKIYREKLRNKND